MGAKLPAYKRLISEFLNESTIHGLKLLLLFVKCHHAKKLWILFMSVNIILTHYIVIKLSIEYINAPTEIRMSTNLVHVANSPFPAVAVCSANKISRRKLKIFAEEVFKHQESFKSRLLSRTPFEMEQELIMLTGFYVHPFKSYEFGDQRLAKLHQILSHMYNSSDYPSSDILLKLAPDCEDIIQRALIFGKMVNPRSLIIKNLTSLSVCCMFNYQRRRSNLIDDVNKEFNKITFQSNSILNSVQFVLQDDPNDTSYRDLPIDAFQIFLFPPEDYATLHSNTAGEILVDYNSIFEIQVQPEFSGASKRISQFSPFVRKCFFPAEGQQQIKQAYYSLDECLLVCRMQSMITYCGCVSPALPAEMLNATYCSLLDLPCLSQWRKIWYSWDYFDYVKSNDDAPENSLEKSVTTKSCRMCLPNCQGVEYNIYTNHLPLYKARKGNTYQHGLLKNMSDTKPLAIIKLYFKQRYALETQEDITGNWVELLSRYGGIMSLMYGFSIVSIIELFYYSTGKWFTHIYSTYQRYKNRRVHSNEVWKEGKVIVDSKEHKNITIYWHELAVKQTKLNYFEKAKLINFKKN